MVLLAVVAAGYFFVYRPVSSFVDGWRAPAQSAQLPKPSGNVNAPLTVPEVQAFVRVRRKEREALGNSFGSVQSLFRNIQDGQNVGVWQVVGTLRDVGNSLGQTRRAQVDALIKEQLSRERYNAVAAGVNRSLGVPDIDFGRVASDIRSGKVPDINTSVKTDADPRTTKLIEPFKTELSATAALGLLGL